MKEIILTQGQFALVDDEDFEEISKYKWSAAKDKERYVAHRNSLSSEGNGKRRTMLMHRVIMKAPKGKDVDHINRNTLDNRKENLRVCTHAENMRNQKVKYDGFTGFKGVVWNKRNQKYMGQIKFNGKRIHLGYSVDKQELARRYNIAAKKYFGKFALLNIIKT